MEGEADGYYSSGKIAGSKHFGVWPLSQAAEASFGSREWPAGDVVPQASIDFEVEDAEAVTSAAGELKRAGYQLLHHARTEPWGQTVARLLTKDGLIVGISDAYSWISPPSRSRRLSCGYGGARRGVGLLSVCSGGRNASERCGRCRL